MLLKILVVGVLLAFGEVINGNIRVRVLHRLYGKKRAKKISFFSGITIIYAISWLTLPWVSPVNYFDCYKIGFVWLVIMLGLDIYFGRYVFKFKWSKIIEDFNPLKGNLLGVGMLLLFLSPSIVFWMQQ
ncbi:hypothetical protein [Sulfurovum sp. TSL1]|uniref:hypothetical protein n=1 Tax=Sulfurovum sp. TSL1 TaxID=2826994 RepID=UPI001CC43BB6|nr:hypothetical protein [Sulfurovum sp. TSL1]GIT97493.1 hypothetical protein TSL1_03140 [Sulfurovum sp. TSL1]